jgi:hypothetical protein
MSNFESPPTRNQREKLNALSEAAYGQRLKWQKIMRKGQLKPSVDVNSNGNPISVMRMHHFTLEEIYKTMSQILEDRAAAEIASKEVVTEKET